MKNPNRVVRPEGAEENNSILKNAAGEKKTRDQKGVTSRFKGKRRRGWGTSLALLSERWGAGES